MTNPVDIRLGKWTKTRRLSAARAQQKRVRQKANEILTEGDRPLAHRQFAESVLRDGVIDIDDCVEMYR